MQTEYLLHQSQSLTAELQSQQEELKKTNDRLEQQALNLQKSEALLKSKQDELRAANEQLQEKARQLSEQMHQVEFKNREIEQARAALEEKAEQLSLSSRYKSRVPRQHVARAAHAAQQPADPGAAAGRQRRRQPDAEAGRVRAAPSTRRAPSCSR